MAAADTLSVQLELQAAAFQKGIDQANKSLATMAEQSAKTQASLGKMESVMTGLVTRITAAGQAFFAWENLKGIADRADDLNRMAASFNAMAGSAKLGAAVMAETFNVVAAAGTPLSTTADAMQGLTNTMVKMGANSAQIGQVAENIAKLAQLGGQGPAQAAQSIERISDALADGRVSSEELNNMLKTTPLIVDAVAEGLGVSRDQLVDMAKQGKLTSDVFTTQLLKATEKVNQQFATMGGTLEGSINAASGALAEFMMKLDGGNTISRMLQAIFGQITDILRRWTVALSDANGNASALGQIFSVILFPVKLIGDGIAVIIASLDISVSLAAALARTLGAIATLNFSNIGNIWKQFNIDVNAAGAALGRTIAAIHGVGAAAQATSRDAEELRKRLAGMGGGAAGGGKGGADQSQKELDALMKRGQALADQVDPLHRFNTLMAEYTKLLEAGAISDVTYARAVQQATDQLNAKANAIRASMDPNEAFRQSEKALAAEYMAGRLEVEEYVKALELLQKKRDEQLKAANPWIKAMEQMAETFAQATGQFFKDLITGSKNAGDAFKQFVATMIAEIAKLIAKWLALKAVKMIFGDAAVGATGGGGAAPLGFGAAGMALAAPTAWSAGRSLASPGQLASTRNTAGVVQPFQVTINNNAPVNVETEQRGNELLVTIERVRSAITADIVRGGSQVANALERTYLVQRGR